MGGATSLWASSRLPNPSSNPNPNPNPNPKPNPNLRLVREDHERLGRRGRRAARPRLGSGLRVARLAKVGVDDGVDHVVDRGALLVALAQLVVVGGALRELLHVVLLHGHRVLDAEVHALAEDADRGRERLQALRVVLAALGLLREELPALQQVAVGALAPDGGEVLVRVIG